MSEADELVTRVRAALSGVIDPELGFNIVDLGLVYDIAVADGGVAKITMTTTTRGCPATDYLQQGASHAAQSIDGVDQAEVRLVYEPPWTPEMMTSAARRYFGVVEADEL